MKLFGFTIIKTKKLKELNDKVFALSAVAAMTGDIIKESIDNQVAASKALIELDKLGYKVDLSKRTFERPEKVYYNVRDSKGRFTKEQSNGKDK